MGINMGDLGTLLIIILFLIIIILLLLLAITITVLSSNGEIVSTKYLYHKMHKTRNQLSVGPFV